MIVISAIATLFPRRHVVHSRTSAMDEIESVVASGKEVTIHEAPISAHGFTGSGYVAIDPQTGAGAYIIEGGGRGGYVKALAASALLVALGAIIEVAGAPPLLLALATKLMNDYLQKIFEITDIGKVFLAMGEALITMLALLFCAAACPAAYLSVLIGGTIFATFAAVGQIACYISKSTYGPNNNVVKICEFDVMQLVNKAFP